MDARADDDAVEGMLLVVRHHDVDAVLVAARPHKLAAVVLDPLDGGAHLKLNSLLGDAVRQTHRVPVDVTRKVGGCEEATDVVVAVGERRLDLRELLRRDGVALEARLRVERVHELGVLVLLLVAIEVQDAAELGVEVEVVRLGVLEQQLARGDGEADRVERVGLVVGDLREELEHPAVLVPARRRVDQERRIALRHPFHALEDRAPRVPHLRVRCRELTAVGKGRLHRRVSVPIEDRHVKAALHEGARGGHAGDAGADDSYLAHFARTMRREPPSGLQHN
mmetsp:Transcript_29940/g.73669  ORF Transcript_29940/g.73669 Transcript_29940/m.73669 type:complete len:281 (-) Transcript_29940:22-864(-)